MTRGGPIKRARDVRVRLTPAEYAAWTAARERSGRRELGAWVREVMNDLLDRAADTPSSSGAADLGREDQIDVAAYAALVRIGNNLNQLTRWANTERRYPAEHAAAATYHEVRTAVATIRASIRAAQRRRRAAR